MVCILDLCKLNKSYSLKTMNDTELINYYLAGEVLS